MAESMDPDVKHNNIDIERSPKFVKPASLLIQSVEPSNRPTSEEEEVTEQPSPPLLDPEVSIPSCHTGDMEIDKTFPVYPTKDELAAKESEQSDFLLVSLNTEHTVHVPQGVLVDIIGLTLTDEENAGKMPSQAEGFTEEAKSVQGLAFDVTDYLKTPPLMNAPTVATEDNNSKITLGQDQTEYKSTGNKSSGDILNGTASNEIMSSEDSVAQWNTERLTSDTKTGNKNATSSAVLHTVTSSNSPLQSRYELKKIPWFNHIVPIVTQNENGPCPLIAIANILLMRSKIVIPLTVKEVTAEQLMEYVAHCIMENVPKNLSDTTQLNYEQNMHDAIGVLPRLVTGLDVNIKFTGVRDFEYTPECIIFDLLNIPLYHGWLVDPQAKEVVDAIGNLGYNQLVEKIILNKFSNDSESVTQALTAEMFLENSATQLTYHGLCELNSTMVPNELAVLFRNNHFSTIYKRKNEIFQLVTDQGFLNEPRVIWEALCNIEGDSTFVDGKFTNSPRVDEAGPGPDVFTPLPESISTEQQIKHDFLVALSLQEDQAIDQKCEEPWEGFEDVGSNLEVSSINLELARYMNQGYQQDTSSVPSRSSSSKNLRSPDRKKKELGCTVL